MFAHVSSNRMKPLIPPRLIGQHINIFATSWTFLITKWNTAIRILGRFFSLGQYYREINYTTRFVKISFVWQICYPHTPSFYVPALSLPRAIRHYEFIVWKVTDDCNHNTYSYQEQWTKPIPKGIKAFSFSLVGTVRVFVCIFLFYSWQTAWFLVSTQ